MGRTRLAIGAFFSWVQMYLSLKGFAEEIKNYRQEGSHAEHQELKFILALFNHTNNFVMGFTGGVAVPFYQYLLFYSKSAIKIEQASQSLQGAYRLLQHNLFEASLKGIVGIVNIADFLLDDESFRDKTFEERLRIGCNVGVGIRPLYRCPSLF